MDSGSELVQVPITPQKHDPAWKHCQMFKSGEKVLLKCIYCFKMFKGGGIHRIKEHLAGHKGNAATCLRTPPDVRLLMQQSLDGVVVKKRRKQQDSEEITNVNASCSGIDVDVGNLCDVSVGMQLIASPESVEPISRLLVSPEEGGSKSGDKRKRGRCKGFAGNTEFLAVCNGLALGPSRVNNQQVHLAIGRWLYDIGAPLDAVNSVHFQPMIDAIASGGPGVSGPSTHDLRGWVLKNVVDEVKNDFEKHTMAWGSTGCSILVDQWITEMGSTLLNLSVYSPEGIVFLKCVDGSSIVNSSEALYEVFKEVVEEVGKGNVLQIITSGEEQYALAGKKLMEAYPTLYWAPCAIKSLDLILEDFGKLDWIYSIVQQVKGVTSFVYNQSVVLNMMRRYTYGNDMVDPGVSSSATDFTTLKRICDLKHNLQAMVTSQEWMDCPHSKNEMGLEMLDLLNSDSFWSSCTLIVRLTSPLLRLLKIVSSEKKCAMGYVYAGMYRAKEAIKREIVKREDYLVYWNIINKRWEQQCDHPLHAAGFYLNPKFFYSIEGDIPHQIKSGMFDCIERLVPDINIQDKISKELNGYENAQGDFGRKMAIRARDTVLPVEWWSTYGGGCPNLKRLAVRILSQTCSSMGCKRSQIPFEQLQKVNNGLERQRLSDLVFVHCNLPLKQRGSKSTEPESMDPLSIDCVDSIQDWIAMKETSSLDSGTSNWAMLDPPSSSTMLLGSSIDENDDLGAGFYDFEVFNREKEAKDVVVEDNGISQ